MRAERRTELRKEEKVGVGKGSSDFPRVGGGGRGLRHVSTTETKVREDLGEGIVSLAEGRV